MTGIKLIDDLPSYGEKTAIIDGRGDYSYARLDSASSAVASRLLDGRKDLCEARVAFLVMPGFEYVAIMLGIWKAGGIAVPLCVSHPDPELDYVLGDSGAGIIISGGGFEDRLEAIALKRSAVFIRSTDLPGGEPGISSVLNEDRRAMIIYTSGTSGRPKGVVSTHANINAQISSLVQAWEWTGSDFILNVLPLHHLHGILNALLCPLRAGAKCELMQGFDAAAVWEKFTSNDYTLFMAVPTIYSRLIRVWEEAAPDHRKKMSEALGRMRLMISGSAALPVSTLEKWKEISGHVLLERYGMTEIGMALSNPLHGERLPGRVGAPLPGVDAELLDEDGGIVSGPGTGEIIVRGGNVFLEYWQKAEATAESFTEGGWFRTGDVAERDGKGVYRILGRNSVDIIKSGGYKISALEIEEALREHPDISECAVVGVKDDEWGERVCAAIVPYEGADIRIKPLRAWCKERLAPYKVPSRIVILDELPRNQMGKVIKPEVSSLFPAEPG